MKKWIAPIAGLICLAICVAVLLFSCNGSDNTDPKPTEGTTTPAPTTAEPTAPVETTPAETTVPETTPVQTTPVETTPVETTPVQTTPVATTPVATQPSGGSSPGGTGGFEGGTTGGVVTPEPEEIEVPEPGTVGNPFAESVLALPDSFTTFSIPAGGSVTYRISGLGGNRLSIADADATVTVDGVTYGAENGVVNASVAFSAKPVTVTVGNTAAEDKAFTLEVLPPVGSEICPEEVSDITRLSPVFTAGKTRHYYLWTPTDAGILTLRCTELTPENANVTIVMTSLGDTSTTDENGTYLDVIAGEPVTICVTLADAEEATALISGSFEANLGTLSNPIQIVDPDSPFAATVPGETTVYYSGYLHEMTVHMLNYEDVVLLIGYEAVDLEDGNIIYTFPAADGVGRPQSVVFGLNNTSDTETSYTLTFTYPLGSLMNPAELAMGENTATIRADNGDGYTYTWTAAEEGKLVLTMEGDNWQYVVNNLTQGVYGELQDAAMDPSVAEYSIPVMPGDEISVNVNGFNAEDPWSLPGGTVTFYAAFAYKDGSRENPYAIFELTEPYVVTIAAEETVYLTGQIFDVDLLVENAVGLELTCGSDDAYDENGVLTYHFPPAASMGRPEPVVFCLSNATDEDATYTLNFIFPEGTAQNPAPLILGENTATVAAGNEDGYIYNWTATADGEFTVTMGDAAWSYAIHNLTAGTYGDTHMSDDEPSVPSETVTVSEGDVLQLVVNTDPGSFATPAGSVTFTAAFVEPDLGTEANPEEVMGQFPIDTQKMLPGTSRYYDVYGCSGMIIRTDATITVNGEAYDGSVLNVGRGEAVHLVVINDTHSSNRFLIHFEFPTGHPENPDTMSLGSNSTTLEAADDDGYTYAWTADADGTLVVTMGSGAWQYVLSNETAGTVGDLMDSSMTAAAVAKLEVHKGDRVNLNVNAFDPAAPWDYPGGQVSFTAEFYENEVTLELLAEETASAKTLTVSSGDLAKGGKAYLVISAVTDQQSGESVPYRVNGSDADGSKLLVISASQATEWVIAQESGAELEATYAVIYVYENIPAQPETTDPEVTEPETTDPEATQPETTEPEATEPEATQPEATQPEATQPETTEPEATQPEATEPTEPEELPQPEEAESDPAVPTE